MDPETSLIWEFGRSRATSSSMSPITSQVDDVGQPSPSMAARHRRSITYCRRHPIRVIVTSLSSHVRQTRSLCPLCSPSTANGPHQYCNRVLCQHLCVIPHATSSSLFDPASRAPVPAQHHRQTHPNADADSIARKLPTNNINAFDRQDESAPMGLYSAHDFKVQKVVRRATTKDIVMML